MFFFQLTLISKYIFISKSSDKHDTMFYKNFVKLNFLDSIVIQKTVGDGNFNSPGCTLPTPILYQLQQL